MNSDLEPPEGTPDNAARPLPGDEEHRVEEIGDRYLDQLQAGEAPDHSAVVAAHPELAGLLDARLAFVEALHRAARQHSADGLWDTSGGSPVSSRTHMETVSLAPYPSTPESLSARAGAAEPLPQRFGRYLVRELLGHGASGIVYRAYDPKFGREVALKVFRSAGPLGTDFAERFQREARVAAHPEVIYEDKKFSYNAWTHDLESLVVVAGLKADRDADALANPALYMNWHRVKDWTEESRYLQKIQVEAQQLFDAVADPANGVMQWIRLRW
jgi:hypothetical protein